MFPLSNILLAGDVYYIKTKLFHLKIILMKKIIFVALAISVAIFSCKKSDTSTPSNNNNNNNTTTTGPYSSLSSVYASLNPQSKTVSVNVASGASFYGNSGTRYIFPANCFQTQIGTSVTGTVLVQVNEFLTKGDMIFSGILPYSNGNALFSGGEISVSATQNSQSLFLKPYNTFQANIPQFGATNNTGMSLFSGQPNQTTNNIVNWALDDSTRGYIIYNGDTIGIFSDSLGLCNADRFMTNPNYQNFSVNATGITIPTDSNVSAYVMYDNYKGIWKLTGSGNSFTENHVPNIPVHFVVFTVINGYFYAGITAATPATGSTYTVNLSQTTPAVFKAQLDSL